MFPFDFGPLLSGILLGITFGLVSGISKEERVKQIAVSVFGAIIVAFLGINLYYYGLSLDVFLELLVWSCTGFILTFLIALGYCRREDKPYGRFVDIDEPPWRIREIQSNAPKIDAGLRIIGNLFLGFKAVISLKMQNTSEEILNGLNASLRISDLGLEKKEKERFIDLPNLVPTEEREYTIREKIGRSRNYAIDLRIKQSAILLEEFHWTTNKAHAS